jgi:2-oxoglutarate ferredoxin oxidoreductase subunit delta
LVKGRVIIDSERCKGCGLCPTVCPQKILSLSETTNSQGVPYSTCIDASRCTGCAFCATICPECAITVFRMEGNG